MSKDTSTCFVLYVGRGKGATNGLAFNLSPSSVNIFQLLLQLVPHLPSDIGVVSNLSSPSTSKI